MNIIKAFCIPKTRKNKSRSIKESALFPLMCNMTKYNISLHYFTGSSLSKQQGAGPEDTGDRPQPASPRENTPISMTSGSE